MKFVASPDRRVHAFNADTELVRYDRSGTWWIEPKDGRPRKRVTITEAVDAVMRWWQQGGSPVIGLPGGSRFDYLLRQRCEAAHGSEERR